MVVEVQVLLMDLGHGGDVLAVPGVGSVTGLGEAWRV